MADPEESEVDRDSHRWQGAARVHPKVVSDFLDNPEICDIRRQFADGLSQKQLVLGRNINEIGSQYRAFKHYAKTA
jgi:hypothetical protein